MLIGESAEMLTIIYGPAPVSHWSLLHNTPLDLIKQNGLWEAVLGTSDAILIDSSTASNLKTQAFLGSHWQGTKQPQNFASFIVAPSPTSIGENDVDTAIHLIFAHSGKQKVFEGLCNPPGGDWSGISLQTPNQNQEMRWLTLPRVTAPNSKRPDHVLQIFGISKKPIILIIESKEFARNVERDIGTRLIEYVKALMQYPASVQRADKTSHWSSQTILPSASHYEYVSAAGFVLKEIAELDSVAKKANTDLVLGFLFDSGGISCNLHVFAHSDLGRTVLDWLLTLDTKALAITIIGH